MAKMAHGPNLLRADMADDRIAILFDIDRTLLVTGGAGSASWRLAFDALRHHG
jgi:hypothetical protein